MWPLSTNTIENNRTHLPHLYRTIFSEFHNRMRPRTKTNTQTGTTIQACRGITDKRTVVSWKKRYGIPLKYSFRVPCIGIWTPSRSIVTSVSDGSLMSRLRKSAAIFTGRRSDESRDTTCNRALVRKLKFRSVLVFFLHELLHVRLFVPFIIGSTIFGSIRLECFCQLILNALEFDDRFAMILFIYFLV